MRHDMPQNRFKRALAAGKPQIGLWLSLASPAATEVAAGAGFDWLLLDMEHAPNELPDIAHHLRAAEGGTAEPVVRVPWNDAVMVKRLLDIGARSLLFPFVQSAEEARRAVAATRYPPYGIRGFAGTTRANRYGRIPDYAKRASDEICVLVQCETRKAVADIPAIAALDGIDGIFIGPADLAADTAISPTRSIPRCSRRSWPRARRYPAPARRRAFSACARMRAAACFPAASSSLPFTPMSRCWRARPKRW